MAPSKDPVSATASNVAPPNNPLQSDFDDAADADSMDSDERYLVRHHTTAAGCSRPLS